MSDRQEPPYAVLAGLTALGIILVLPAFLVDGLSDTGRWVLVAVVVWLACTVAYYLWRARR